MSGNDIKDVQPSKSDFAYLIFEVFHLDISGIDNKEEQLQNIP